MENIDSIPVKLFVIGSLAGSDGRLRLRTDAKNNFIDRVRQCGSISALAVPRPGYLLDHVPYTDLTPEPRRLRLAGADLQRERML